MALNPLFLNQCFDKNRLKNLITWSLLTVGERQTIETVENLKSLGFEFATQAGVSLSVDDLKIPPEKLSLVSQASQQVEATQQAYQRGNLTAIEKLQQLVDTWHRTSETLKQTVVNHFQSTDKLSPVYMMAFSGARGNISQVRQLAGMRGLMADPQGQIIGFPIRSNFREGLTLTEYMISCYGARKGLVDTALRTADAGYLTRRLVDVSQHMIVKAATCATPRGIVLKDLQSSTKVVFPLRERLIGRVLAEDVVACNELPEIGKGSHAPSLALLRVRWGGVSPPPSKRWEGGLQTPSFSPGNEGKTSNLSLEGSNATIGVSPDSRQPGLVAYRNQEISAELASRIASCRNAVLVRSPLTCSIRHGVCQLCYGWSLSEGRLVTLGEAVGIIAAQSIGEPGTQLTMRTFHTGGVFSGDVMAEVRAPHDGVVDFPQPLQGLLIRTSHGKIAFLTKAPGSLLLRSERSLTMAEEETLFSLEPLTVLFVRQNEKVARRELIAEFSSMGTEMNETVEAKRILFSEIVGQVSFANVSLGTRLRESGDVLQVSRNLGFVWILSGRRSSVTPLLGIYSQGSHLVNQGSLVARVASKQMWPTTTSPIIDENPSIAKRWTDSHSTEVRFELGAVEGGPLRNVMATNRIGDCSNTAFSTAVKFVPNIGYWATTPVSPKEGTNPTLQIDHTDGHSGLNWPGTEPHLPAATQRPDRQPKTSQASQEFGVPWDGFEGHPPIASDARVARPTRGGFPRQPWLVTSRPVAATAMSSPDCLLFSSFPLGNLLLSYQERSLSAMALPEKSSLAPFEEAPASRRRGSKTILGKKNPKRFTCAGPISATRPQRTDPLVRLGGRGGYNETGPRSPDFYWLPGDQKSGQTGVAWVDSRYIGKSFAHGEIVWMEKQNLGHHAILSSQASKDGLKNVVRFNKKELFTAQGQHFLSIDGEQKGERNKTGTTTAKLGRQGAKAFKWPLNNVQVEFAARRTNPLVSNNRVGNQQSARVEGESQREARGFYKANERDALQLATRFVTSRSAVDIVPPQYKTQLGAENTFKGPQFPEGQTSQDSQGLTAFQGAGLTGLTGLTGVRLWGPLPPTAGRVRLWEPLPPTTGRVRRFAERVQLYVDRFRGSSDGLGLVLDGLVKGTNPAQKEVRELGKTYPHVFHLHAKPGWVYSLHDQANLPGFHESIQFCGGIGLDNLFFDPALVYLEAFKGGKFLYSTADSLLIASLRVQLLEMGLPGIGPKKRRTETGISPAITTRGSLFHHLATQGVDTQIETKEGQVFLSTNTWASHLFVSNLHPDSDQHLKGFVGSKPLGCYLAQGILLLLRKTLWLSQAFAPTLVESTIGESFLQTLLQKRTGGGDVTRQHHPNRQADLYQILFLRNLLNREPFLWLRAFPLQVQVVTNQKARHLGMARHLHNRLRQATNPPMENLPRLNVRREILLLTASEKRTRQSKNQTHVASPSKLVQAKPQMEGGLLPLVQTNSLLPYAFALGLTNSYLPFSAQSKTLKEPGNRGPGNRGPVYLHKLRVTTWLNAKRIVRAVQLYPKGLTGAGLTGLTGVRRSAGRVRLWGPLPPTAGWVRRFAERARLQARSAGKMQAEQIDARGVLSTSLGPQNGSVRGPQGFKSLFFEPALASPSVLVLIRKGHCYPLSMLEKSKAIFLRRQTLAKIFVNKRLPIPLTISNSLAFSTKQSLTPLLLDSPDIRFNLAPLIPFEGFQTAFLSNPLYCIRFAGSFPPSVYEKQRRLQAGPSTKEATETSCFASLGTWKGPYPAANTSKGAPPAGFSGQLNRWPRVLQVSKNRTLSSATDGVEAMVSPSAGEMVSQWGFSRKSSEEAGGRNSQALSRQTKGYQATSEKGGNVLFTQADHLSLANEGHNSKACVGEFVSIGGEVVSGYATPTSGQVVAVEKDKITLRRTQALLFYAQGVMHVNHGEWVENNAPILTLTYQKLITGDIVQGIPKIEQFFEAPATKEGEPLPNSLQARLRKSFQRLKQLHPVPQAVKRSLEEIQQMLVEGILKVYLSQGVRIADKHLEIVIRQMTSKGQVLDVGQTGLFQGEHVRLDRIERINLATYGQKADYEPAVLGITQASLDSESFISAASFQETTRVLSRDTIIGKTDFLRGLKERVVLGDLIQAGTGLDDNINYGLLFGIAPTYGQGLTGAGSKA